jgi:hypothetical protein
MWYFCVASRSPAFAPGTKALTQDYDRAKTANRVSDIKTASWIAALERARAELEQALGADPRRRAPHGALGDADWAGYERALEGHPVLHCWAQLNRAIEDLRQAQAEAQAEAAVARRRVSLRDVLEQLRRDPILLQDAERHGAASDAARTEAGTPASDPPPPMAPSGMPAPPKASDRAPPEAEEASVSFVIREPARSAPMAGNQGKAPAPGGPASLPETPKAAKAEPDPGAEAEVVIVSRQR